MTKENTRQTGCKHPLKHACAKRTVKQWKSRTSSMPHVGELPRDDLSGGWDCVTIRASAPDTTTVFLGIRKLIGKEPLAEVIVHVKLSDGTTYKHTQHPDTIVGAWVDTKDGWSAGGLKIQVLDPELRLRILYNGLLTRTSDNTIQHVRFNLLWASATPVVRHPQDWSEELSVQALESEQRSNGHWSYLLGKYEDGNWMQWGTLQGLFQSYDGEGTLDRNEYLRTRGVRERSWAGQGWQDLQQSVTITVAARDGTAIQVRALSFKNSLTHCISGSVRSSDCRVSTLTSTDLNLSLFRANKENAPKDLTFNVGTKERNFKITLKVNTEGGGKLLSGLPYQQEVEYRTLLAEVDGESGTGILEFGHESTGNSKPRVQLSPTRTLRWLNIQEVDKVGYCVTFEQRAAACPEYVGGKGASLALLASVQADQGYQVPPGFCLTIYALERQLEAHPELKQAIKQIESASEDYDEKVFKSKCENAADLFVATEIASDLKDVILNYLGELRVTAKQISSSELRFAVRSSAVGEDSEVLSAAGQNETILGCSNDEDILQGVQKCWASMFSFTSVYYRRQNGQLCLCGAGVVVQALVTPQIAGVMFTRHPDGGDPSRLLITANYGLGESVVSGSVEPDTIIVKRGQDGSLSIMKLDVGSKTGRVVCGENGVATEEVSDDDRGVLCLTEEQALHLAKIGVTQEELWGAGRDIEWAILEDNIYLLQARPITSLERWTKEELLHELDFPIMADDELLSTANIGEVMPKPVTPLTSDIIGEPMGQVMSKIMDNDNLYDRNLIMSHCRGFMALYNSTYRHISKKPDVTTIHFLEMTIHGHKVADEKILSTALRRRAPHWKHKVFGLKMMLKSLYKSKKSMNDTVKGASKLTIHECKSENPLELLNTISDSSEEVSHYFFNHLITTYASIASQLIATSVLLEGREDFTLEQCSEICALMSSGDTVSAEVPLALNKLANTLKKSGRVDEFKAQDPKNALQWLKENLPDVHKDVCIYLEKYGHRALMEIDLSTKPWALVPEEMMTVLQNMCLTAEENQNNNVERSDRDIISSLKTPQKTSTRKILRKLLPLCRRTVAQRESTKAYLVLAVHKMRLACIRLGKLLVKQWYLPDYELVFFFRLNELRNFIKNRDPEYLVKAIQRCRYYPEFSDLKFPELMYGWPEPLKPAPITVTSDADARVKAMSICGGEVIARACVVKQFSEVSCIQRGDILITHSTDIGWSPYFPLLSGIVTELGGLISHGAVIAREYGLPCLVGATDATQMFKTGDMVRLSGISGILERVKLDDQNDNNDKKINDVRISKENE